jgi:hypothetical protein
VARRAPGRTVMLIAEIDRSMMGIQGNSWPAEIVLIPLQHCHRHAYTDDRFDFEFVDEALGAGKSRT